MYKNQGVSLGFYDRMHIRKTQTSTQGQICIFPMSNFLKKWLDQYTISDNIGELETEFSFTFMLITTLTLSQLNLLIILKLGGESINS